MSKVATTVTLQDLQHIWDSQLLSNQVSFTAPKFSPTKGSALTGWSGFCALSRDRLRSVSFGLALVFVNAYHAFGIDTSCSDNLLSLASSPMMNWMFAEIDNLNSTGFPDEASQLGGVRVNSLFSLC